MQKLKIEYRCDLCGKTRLMLIPEALNKNVDERGLNDYIDVHSCTNSKDTAVLLNVDSNNVVRAQLYIHADEIDEKKEDEFGIPLPNKGTDSKIMIRDLYTENITAIELVDKFRSTRYCYKCEDGSTHERFIIDSNLKFIKIELSTNKKLVKENVERWMKVTVDALEHLTFFDEDVFKYLLSYLDANIFYTCQLEDEIEIDALTHGNVSIIKTEPELLELYDMKWKEFYPHFLDGDYKKLRLIIECALDNQKLTLFDIFQYVVKQVGKFYSFKAYLDDLGKLIVNGLIYIEKMQFITFT